MSEKRQQAADAGVAPEEIDRALGYQGGDDAEKRMWDRVRGNLEAVKPAEGEGQGQPAGSPWEAFVKGVEGSSGGMIVGSMLGKETDLHPLWENPDRASRIFYKAGGLVGDLPAMMGGAAAGALAGAATGPGAAITAGAGAFALPAAIREEYSQAFVKGQVKGPADFAERQAAVLWSAAKSAAIGAATGGAGKLAQVGAETIGAGALSTFAAKTTAELSAMTGTAAAIEGQLPKTEDVIDGALTLAVFVPGVHVAGRVAEHAANTVVPNLMDNWAKTGESPVVAARRAVSDPSFRVQLMQPRPEEPPEGSSETPTPEGNFVLPKVRVPHVTVEVVTDKAKELTKAGVVAEGDENPIKSVQEAYEEAASRFAAEEPKQTSMERIKSLGWKVYGELFRPDYPLNQIQDAYEGKIGAVEDFANPKFLRRAAELSDTTAKYMIERGMIDARTRAVTGPGLNDILKPFENEKGPANFWNYALARETLKDTSKPTGLTPESALTIAQDGEAKYAETYDKLVTWRNGTLKYSLDRGYMSQEAYDRITAEGNLPLYRAEEAGALPHASPNAAQSQPGGSVAMERKGSDLPIKDIRVSLMQDAFRRSHLADQNAANLAIARLAGELQVAKVVRSQKAVVLPSEEDGLGKDMGGLDDPAHFPLSSLLEKKGWTFKSDEVPILNGGNVDVWRFNDPAVTNFLKAAPPAQQTTFAKIANTFAKLQRTSIVLNPVFPVRLLTYDVPWQFITKPEYRNTLAQTFQGLREVVGNGDMYDRWMRSGGAEKVFDGLGKSQYIKQTMDGLEDKSMAEAAWNGVKTPFRALQTWGQMLNQATRVGNFKARIENGESDQNAAAASTEAAFHRAGFGGPLAKQINAIQPFTAAYLNSLEQTVRGQFGIGKTVTSVDYNATKFTLGALAAVTMPMLATWYENRDQEWYKSVPQWQKDNGMNFRVGNTTLYIPLPPILGFVYGGLPKRLMESFVNDNPHAWDHIGQGLVGAFAPPIGAFITGTIAQPIVEKLANHSFFRDRPLVPDTMKDILPQYQYTPYTTETAKSLSKFFNDVPLLRSMNMKPVEIDNFIQEWSGGLGRMAVRGAEQAAQSAGLIKTNAPAMKPEDWLGLFGAVTARYPSVSAQPIIDFEERMGKVNGIHATLDKLMKDRDLSGFQQTTQNYPAETLMHGMKAKTPPPAEMAQYKDAALAGKSPEVINALRGVHAADAALKALRTATYYIGQVPLKEVQPMSSQEYLAHVSKMVGANPPPASMSANDKRQLLDMAYSYMQSVAERGIQYMDKAGIK